MPILKKIVSEVYNHISNSFRDHPSEMFNGKRSKSWGNYKKKTYIFSVGCAGSRGGLKPFILGHRRLDKL